jgi:hypothetical protein
MLGIKAGSGSQEEYLDNLREGSPYYHRESEAQKLKKWERETTAVKDG